MKTYNNPLSLAIDNFFNQNLSDVFGVDVLPNRPAVNMKEEADKHILEIAVPGVAKEDINIEIDKNMLKISAETKTEKDESTDADDRKYIRREFNYSKFERSFHVPESANLEAITANYDAGVLFVTIGKKEEAVDNGPINIKVS